MFNVPAYFYFALAGLLAVIIPSLYYLRKHYQKMILRKALSLALYEVSLPRLKKEQGKSFKDIVASMEQFYAGMSSFRPYFVLELASPATENETDFYVAVPRNASSLFESQVHAVFPTAEIREENSDYNTQKRRSGFG